MSALPDDALRSLLEAARSAAWKGRSPAPRRARQPLHTVYVPADRFTAGTVAELGGEALRLLERHAADAGSFTAAFGVAGEVAARARERVLAKLRREPVEDVRIDFEDGYGGRPQAEEERHAALAAEAVAAAGSTGSFAASYGVRVKSFADDLAPRSVGTLDVFLRTLVRASGRVPEGLVVTFPKVVASEHVALFAETLGVLEGEHGLPEGAIDLEVQVETPESLVEPGGLMAIPAIVAAAGGRLSGLHFGVFDYTAALGLMPWEQRLDHPANDFARHLVQVAVAGTGVQLSDGSTNVVPASDRTEDVHAAWRAHADHVRHSLAAGFLQGWDLHAAHLASRYAAVYGWLLPHLDDAVDRVRAWRQQASAEGVLDEPATVRSLLRYLRFAVTSGAVDGAEVLERAGLGRDELLG